MIVRFARFAHLDAYRNCVKVSQLTDNALPAYKVYIPREFSRRITVVSEGSVAVDSTILKGLSS